MEELHGMEAVYGVQQQTFNNGIEMISGITSRTGLIVAKSGFWGLLGVALTGTKIVQRKPEVEMLCDSSVGSQTCGALLIFQQPRLTLEKPR